MAKTLGMPQRTFQGYLNEKRQDNLWTVLPKILEMYPRLSRQWLYFEEGPMFIGQDVPLDQPVPLQTIQQAVELMARDAAGHQQDVVATCRGTGRRTGYGGKGQGAGRKAERAGG